MNLIKVGNLILNLSQLIDAEFTPASGGVDEETGRQFNRMAKLELRFAGPQSEPHTNYDGDYVGFADHSPYSRILRGEEAEEVFSELCMRDTRKPKETGRSQSAG